MPKINNPANSKTTSEKIWNFLKNIGNLINNGGDLWMLLILNIVLAGVTVIFSKVCYCSNNSWCSDLNLSKLTIEQAMLMAVNVSTMFMGVYFYVVKLNKWGLLRGIIVLLLFSYWIVANHYSLYTLEQIELSIIIMGFFAIVDFILFLAEPKGDNKERLKKNVFWSSIPGFIFSCVAWFYVWIFDAYHYPELTHENILIGAAHFAFFSVFFSNTLFCIVNTTKTVYSSI